MSQVKQMVQELQTTLGQIGGCLKTKAQDWEESKHKRASNGQFGSGGGGASKAAAGGEKAKAEPMTRAQKREKMDQLNDKIREAHQAVKEAEWGGLRGEAMIKLKSDLRVLSAQHKKIASTLD